MFWSVRFFPALMFVAAIVLSPVAQALADPATSGLDPALNSRHVADRWFLEQDEPAPAQGSTRRHVVDRWFDTGGPSSAMYAEAADSPSLRAPAEPEPDTKHADD